MIIDLWQVMLKKMGDRVVVSNTGSEVDPVLTTQMAIEAGILLQSIGIMNAPILLDHGTVQRV